jgi:hypothetical protein
VERREQVTRVETDLGQRATAGPRWLDGRRQPFGGGTSRISRGAYVRFCESLGVQFPGATRRVGATAVATATGWSFGSFAISQTFVFYSRLQAGKLGW